MLGNTRPLSSVEISGCRRYHAGIMKFRCLAVFLLCGLAPGAFAQRLSNIQISGGISRNVSLLSVPDDGSKSDLWFTDDGSGRQRWWLRPGGAGQWYNILSGGGITNDRKYLSVTSDGTKVDLFPEDDGSGRQRWVIERLADGFVHIRIYAGVEGDRRFLSVTSDGTKIDLFPVDDGSGRQRWKILGSGAQVPSSGAHEIATTSYPPPPAGVPENWGDRRRIIDLNGDWEGYYAMPGTPTAIHIHHDGLHISAELLHDDLTTTGIEFFKGEFEPHNSRAHIQVLDLTKLGAMLNIPGGGSTSGTFYMVDFDHVAIDNHPPFQRLSLPLYNDIPCSSSNELSVGAEWAYMRAVVAQKAKDMQAAVCWLYVASIQKDARAAFYLASCIHDSIGTPVNLSQVLQWAKISADNGSEYGANLVALLYERGEGVAKSPDNARYWRQRGEEIKRQRNEQAESDRKREERELHETLALAAISVIGAAVLANEIASDHLCEPPRYAVSFSEYTRLQQDEERRAEARGMQCIDGHPEPIKR
jgi:hypothetical protein